MNRRLTTRCSERRTSNEQTTINSKLNANVCGSRQLVAVGC
jgi:hypothetical protein